MIHVAVGVPWGYTRVMAKSAHVKVRMEPELVDELDRLAVRAGLTRSELVRNMCRDSIPGFRRTFTLLESPVLGRLIMQVARHGAQSEHEQMEIERVMEHFRRAEVDQRGVSGLGFSHGQA